MARTLYLHCGWPRTATSVFQSALSATADELARAGLAYPAEWRHGDESRQAHHGLEELLTREGEPPGPIERFRSDLLTWDGDVLLSSEAISNWIAPRRRPALLRLLETARDTGGVTTLWTLRRMDEFLASMYLHQVLLGRRDSPTEYYNHRFKHNWIDGFIEGNATVGGLDGFGAVQVKYARDGSHCDALLRAAGVAGPLRERILGEIRAAPRTGTQLTQKGMITLAHLDEISTRVGVDLDRDLVAKALHSGTMSFSQDSAFEVIGREMALRVHEAALEAAREHGFTAYVDFFGDDEVEGAPSSSEIDPGMLSEEDLARIAAAGTPPGGARSDRTFARG